MSATVRLSAKLAGDDDLNGLDSEAEQLIDQPATIRCAVIWYDTAKITQDTDAGTTVPTARVRRWEPIGTVDDVGDPIRKLVAWAHEKRTGKAALPFEQYEADEP